MQQSFPRHAESTLSFERLLSVLRARWRAFVTVMVAVVVLTVAVCAIVPARYRATAAVVVDVKSTDPVAGATVQGLMLPSYMGTQVDMLQSERVVLAALKETKALEDPDLIQEWKDKTGGTGDFGSWATEKLTKKLDVLPSRDSNVIEVRYTSIDPAFAAAMANAVVNAYLTTSVALQTEPARRYNVLFDERAKQLRNELEAAQSKLSSYQRENGLVATDERIDVENSRLAELSSQLVIIQTLASDSQSRQAQVGAKSDRLQEVVTNPLVAGLTADLAHEQARLSELTSRLGDQHPQVQQARASVAELRARLESATQRVSGSLGVNNSVNQARVAQLQASLEEQRTKVLRLRAVRDGAQVLQRDVESAQQAYQIASARMQQAALATQNTQTNVLVLKQATVPGLPWFPKWPLVIVVAELVGCLLAFAFVLVRELMDERVRVDDDIVLLGSPLLAVLPNNKAVRGAGPARLGSFGDAKRLTA